MVTLYFKRQTTM